MDHRCRTVPIRNLSRLEVLNLWVTGVSDAGLETLSGLTRLRDLTLAATAITDLGLELHRKAAPPGVLEPLGHQGHGRRLGVANGIVEASAPGPSLYPRDRRRREDASARAAEMQDYL